MEDNNSVPLSQTMLPPSQTGLAVAPYGASAPFGGGAQPFHKHCCLGTRARQWLFTAQEWHNLLGEPTADNLAVEALLGQHAFLRLVAGSMAILRTQPALGREDGKSVGAVLWPQGLTVDITTAAPDDALHLRVPSWKQQEPHDLYALMVHVNYESDVSLGRLLAQPPILELRGFAPAETVFRADGNGGSRGIGDVFVVPQERLVSLADAIKWANGEE